MKNIFSKPLFWSNVAAFLVTGLVVAGVAVAWNNPSSAPVTANGAITTNASGNVGIGAIPDAIAKLHLGGDLLIDTNSGITLNGIKRTDWPSSGVSIGCGAWNQSAATCVIAGTDKVYGVYTFPNGSYPNMIVPVFVGSADAPGVRPHSSIECGMWGQSAATCVVTATDKVYGVYTFPNGSYPNMIVPVFVGSANAPGVTPLSSVNCGVWTQSAATCVVNGVGKAYGVYTFPNGSYPNMIVPVFVGSADIPALSVPQ